MLKESQLLKINETSLSTDSQAAENEEITATLVEITSSSGLCLITLLGYVREKENLVFELKFSSNTRFSF